MKRIIIIAACALFLAPMSEVKAASIPSSPIGVSVTDGDPFDQIMAILGEIKVIKEELKTIQANKENTKKFVDQAALDAAANVFVELLLLQEIQEKYGSVPVTANERTKLIDFLVQNHVVLQDKPITDEAAQEINKKVGGYKTIGELIEGLVMDF